MDTWEDVYPFTNVVYNSGVFLTSNLGHGIPGQIGKAKATLAWSPALEQGRDGLENWYYTAGYTDPNITKTYLRIGDGGPSGHYLTLNPDLFGDPMDFTVSSHIVGD